MRVIFCGGRDYTDRDTVQRVLDAFSPDWVTVVHGGARGADTLVEELATEQLFKTEVFPAYWDTFGKSAGMRRNHQMLEAGADLVVAFPGGSGTKGMARIAYEAGVPVLWVYAK